MAEFPSESGPVSPATAAGASNPVRLSRRAVLQAGAAAGVAAPLVLGGARAVRAAPKALKLTWNANAICTVSVPVAEQRGHFEKHGLKVELINFGGSTD
jgi:NitT/TauT family transport system substrate-binding protein